MNLENLRSFDTRGLTKVKRIGYQTLAHCPLLRDFNPRGFHDVQEIDDCCMSREELVLSKEEQEQSWAYNPEVVTENRQTL